MQYTTFFYDCLDKIMVEAGEVNRMRWAARRGMLELDLLLEPFVDQHYANLSAEDRETFEQFMTCQDQDLYAYLMQRVQPDDPKFAALVVTIRKLTGAPQA
ncbi:MAG: succinate dehydrogenase assembly factor 2 [Aequoribacter sp.]|uniref:FAD assembly factor SdhE n=2 Tax=Aequoribacter sp. TaxID=2847771 RepID=UPI003C69DBF0